MNHHHLTYWPQAVTLLALLLAAPPAPATPIGVEYVRAAILSASESGDGPEEAAYDMRRTVTALNDHHLMASRLRHGGAKQNDVLVLQNGQKVIDHYVQKILALPGLSEQTKEELESVHEPYLAASNPMLRGFLDFQMAKAQYLRQTRDFDEFLEEMLFVDDRVAQLAMWHAKITYELGTVETQARYDVKRTQQLTSLYKAPAEVAKELLKDRVFEEITEDEVLSYAESYQRQAKALRASANAYLASIPAFIGLHKNYIETLHAYRTKLQSLEPRVLEEVKSTSTSLIGMVKEKLAALGNSKKSDGLKEASRELCKCVTELTSHEFYMGRIRHGAAKQNDVLNIQNSQHTLSKRLQNIIELEEVSKPEAQRIEQLQEPYANALNKVLRGFLASRHAKTGYLQKSTRFAELLEAMVELDEKSAIVAMWHFKMAHALTRLERGQDPLDVMDNVKEYFEEQAQAADGLMKKPAFNALTQGGKESYAQAYRRQVTALNPLAMTHLQRFTAFAELYDDYVELLEPYLNAIRTVGPLRCHD